MTLTLLTLTLTTLTLTTLTLTPTPGLGLGLGLAWTRARAAPPAHDEPTDDARAIRLLDVSALVLRRGEWTTGRRRAGVPQMQCVRGACGGDREPETALCERVGVDYATRDPLWRCTATLAAGLHLGATDVTCEGFRYAEDPYVLRGSCGLEYALLGTVASPGPGPSDGASTSWMGGWTPWLAVGAALWLARAWCRAPDDADLELAVERAALGSGSGSGSGSDPAHPFGQWHDWRAWADPDPTACAREEPEPAPTPGNPGFWGGAGLGALAGYVFGRNRGAAYERHRARDEAPFRGMYDRGPFENQPVASVVTREGAESRDARGEVVSAGVGTTKRR